MKSKENAVRVAVPSILHSLVIAIVLVVGLTQSAEARVRDRYQMVTHRCGAVEWYVPVQNLIVVAFARGASDEANFDLARAEGFLVRTTPEETARDGMAIYALPPGEGLVGAMELVSTMEAGYELSRKIKNMKPFVDAFTERETASIKGME